MNITITIEVIVNITKKFTSVVIMNNIIAIVVMMNITKKFWALHISRGNEYYNNYSSDYEQYSELLISWHQ